MDVAEAGKGEMVGKQAQVFAGGAFDDAAAGGDGDVRQHVEAGRGVGQVELHRRVVHRVGDVQQTRALRLDQQAAVPRRVAG